MKPVEWSQLFVPDTNPLEIFIRGSIMYLSIFALFRAFKRQSGGLSLPDLLVIVLVADAAQNGMTGSYKSLIDGLILVGTIVFWNVFLDWLGFHIPLVERIIHPEPLPLVIDGRPIRSSMQRQFITMDELMSQLREQGVESVAQVRKACLEGDGSISVIKASEPEQAAHRHTEANPS
jgi:uncharacterized membrane protein YcaP (DUF421 family)